MKPSSAKQAYQRSQRCDHLTTYLHSKTLFTQHWARQSSSSSSVFVFVRFSHIQRVIYFVTDESPGFISVTLQPSLLKGYCVLWRPTCKLCILDTMLELFYLEVNFLLRFLLIAHFFNPYYDWQTFRAHPKVWPYWYPLECFTVHGSGRRHSIHYKYKTYGIYVLLYIFYCNNNNTFT